jgi:ABC-2 type transport system permease protein
MCSTATSPYGEVAYTSFLVPGLVMMSVLQNAFANSSSSLIQSKITGNIIFVLLPPLSYREFYAAYVIASILRGLDGGGGRAAVSLPLFVDVPMARTRCGCSPSPCWAARSSGRSG